MSRLAFTAKRIAEFKCPLDKGQAFLWDGSPASGGRLALRVTPNGKPSFIFQGRFSNKTIRITIGSPEQWSIPEAQDKAREYQRCIDEGRDPRLVKAEKTREDQFARASAIRDVVTFGAAWDVYVEARRPYWSELSYRDHLKMMQQPGLPRKNRKDVKTVAGPFWPLQSLKLADLTSELVESWAIKEAKRRATRTRLAVSLLRAFLRWADEQPAYSGVVAPDLVATKRLRDVLGKPKAKRDGLEREQLAQWFSHIKELQNPVISAYLQCLLLTGARREELAKLKWGDVNFRWAGMTIGDKVEDCRHVPVTPYVSYLMQQLPRRNQWVFSSPSSKSGRLTEPSIAHRKVCQVIGAEVTLHGLRRSFSNLSEWLEIPAGVVAQIMGHKPSAIAEKHYKQRPLDLLREHHEKLEKWILGQADIEFDVLNKETNPLTLALSAKR